MTKIVLATPHSRYDALEQGLKSLPGIEVTRIRTPEALTTDMLRVTAPRYVFFPHWSWKIPADIHDNFECVIFHMTDVPFGRGGTPLQNLIVRGVAMTKLTALRCVEEMDAGPVYMKRELGLEGRAEEIFARAAVLIGEMIRTIIAEQPQPVPQEGEVVTFARRRPADSDIAKLSEMTQLFDYIRMLDAEGYPRAFLETEHFRLEFSHADLHPDSVEAKVRIVRRKA